MVTRTTKKIAFLSTVFCLVVVCSLIFLLFKIHTVGRELNELSVVIANSGAQRQQNTELQRLLTETSDERTQLTSLLLTEEKTIVFLTEIEAIARKQKVDLTTNALEVIPGAKNAQDKLTIQFAVEGTGTSVKKFIRLLEELPYASEITQLRVSKQQVSDNTLSGTIELSLDLLPHDT